MIPNTFESSELIVARSASSAGYGQTRETIGPFRRAMLIGQPCLVLECLREAMSAKGIATNAAPLEQHYVGSPLEYDVFVMFLMRFEPDLFGYVKERTSELRAFAPRVPIVALVEDSVRAATFYEAEFSTIVLGLPSVPFAVDVINLVLSTRSPGLAPFDQFQEQVRESPEPGVAVPDVFFTSREFELLDFLRQGLQNKQIAYRLGISQSTVKAHLRSIMIKLKAKNRTEAACMLTHEAHRARELAHV